MKFTFFSHDICFVNVLDLFIPVIIFKLSVLLGTYTLLGRPLRVLQLAAHPSKLTSLSH